LDVVTISVKEGMGYGVLPRARSAYISQVNSKGEATCAVNDLAARCRIAVNSDPVP